MFDPILFNARDFFDDDLISRTKQWFQHLELERPNLQVKKSLARNSVLGTENINMPYIGNYLNELVLPQANKLILENDKRLIPAGIKCVYPMGSCINFYEWNCFLPLHVDINPLNYTLSWLIDLNWAADYSLWFINEENKAIEFKQKVDDVILFCNQMKHGRFEIKDKNTSATLLFLSFSVYKWGRFEGLSDKEISKSLLMGKHILYNDLTLKSVRAELTTRNFKKPYNM